MIASRYMTSLKKISCFRKSSVVLKKNAIYASVDTVIVRAVCSQEVDKQSYRGLDVMVDQNQLSSESLYTTIKNIESDIRSGYKAKRQQLHNMVLFVSFWTAYPYISVDYMESARKQLHVGICPDIYVYIIRCMGTNTKTDDELVNFIRSSISFFSNPRRIQKKQNWSVQNEDKLTTLFRCCLPTLLSLYTCVGCKDVDFWMRVSIFSLFRTLLTETHEARCDFFKQNKPLIRACLAEYVMFYMKHISPIPKTKYMENVNFDEVYTNTFNIGQQLRVDINIEVAKLNQHRDSPQISTENCLAVLQSMNVSCQIMYERSLRCNRLLKAKKQRTHNMILSKKPKRVFRAKIVSMLKDCIHILHEIPWIKDFVIFESYCKRQGLTGDYINILWDTIYCVKIVEISTTLIKQQLTSLDAEYSVNTYQMQQKKKLYLCLVCVQYNMSTNFRHDSRNGMFFCTKCDVDGSVFEIDMLGRIVIINNIPLILSPYTNDIVVWNGYYTDLIPEIKWNRFSSLNTLSMIIKNTHLSNCILLCQNGSYLGIKQATRFFVNERLSGNTSMVDLESKIEKKCGFCRSSCIVSRYAILDIYNMTILSVPVCNKHDVLRNYIPIECTNINTFCDLIVYKKSNR